MEKGRERKEHELIGSSVFLSNKMEILLQELSARLFSSSQNPFERRMVVVPDIRVKSYLQYHLATNPALSIASGIEFLSLPSALAEILSLDEREKEVRIPASFEISIRIEAKLKEILKNKRSAPSFFAPLFHYLEEESLSCRLGPLSDQLGMLFSRYGIYGGEFLLEWEEKKQWQQSLWHYLFGPGSYLSYPLKRLREVEPPFFQVHLFGFHFLPRVYLSFFERMKSSFYFLSPCELFWEDLCTEKEKHLIRKTLQRKNAAMEEDDLYLNDQNSFLANMGKLGRRFLRSQSEFNFVTSEEYEQASASPPTLLKCVQRDLLHLRNPSDGPLIEISPEDSSLQVHAATSKRREVEILCELIHKIFSSHEDDPILPRDIIVLAPDISEYSAYIQEVFGSEVKWPLFFTDKKISQESHLFVALEILQSLVKERFSPAAFLKLLSLPSFQEKMGFSLEDVHEIRDWIEKLPILWGVDADHKHLFLGAAKEQDSYSATAGTWDSAFELLFMRLLYLEQEEEKQLPVLQWDGADLLGRLFFSLRSLKEDLSILHDKTEMSFCGWVRYLSCLSHAYFSLSLDEDPLYQELLHLSHHVKDVESAMDFLSFQRFIAQISQKRKAVSSSSLLHAMSIGSLCGGSARSARAIILLGMDEESFPRQTKRSSLCEMSLSAKADYFPTPADEDSYLFLEQLLCAKDYFAMIYCGLSEKDSKEQGPSLAVQELFSYLEKGYFGKNQEPISKILTRHHPSFSFDKRYFSSEEKERSYSETQYLAAKAYYSPKKSGHPLLIPEFYQEMPWQCKAKEKEIVVDIKHLQALAKHPIKFYLNRALGIYLSHSSQEEEEKEFTLTNIHKAKLRKASLQMPINSLLELAEKKQMMPISAFKETARLNLQEECAALKENLSCLGIEKETIFSVEFKRSCETPFISHQGRRIYPALKIPLEEGRIAWIVGRIPDATEKGLLYYGEDTIDDRLLAWPSWLLFSSLCMHNKNFEPNLFLTKKPKKIEGTSFDPIEYLRRYVCYYERAMDNVSPLMPSWAEELLLGNEEGLAKSMKKSISSDLPFDDEYLHWLFQFQPMPNPLILIQRWAPYLNLIFEPLLHRNKKGAKE